jgi:hypothetical protein
MKNILVIAAKYSADEKNPYLTNDLVQELCRQGCYVTVVAYGDENIMQQNATSQKYVIKITSSLKIIKYFLTWPKLIHLLFKIRKKEPFLDQVVMFAPMAVMWPAAFLVKYFRATKKTAIIFDLFPIHQVNINALPKFMAKPLRAFERNLLCRFTEITAMGENNKKTIESYYTANKPVKIMPLWGRGLDQSKKLNNHDCIKIIFGGQLIKGREINALISLFEQLRHKGLPIIFDIYSKDAYFEELKQTYASQQWIQFKDQIPREDYFKRLAEYDVGAIVTDRSSNLPTFPSKIIDYIEANLQVYCLVEKESDLNMLATYKGIYLNHFSFSEDELNQSIDFLKDAKNTDKISQYKELKELFSIKNAVKRLME